MSYWGVLTEAPGNPERWLAVVIPVRNDYVPVPREQVENLQLGDCVYVETSRSDDMLIGVKHNMECLEGKRAKDARSTVVPASKRVFMNGAYVEVG